MQTTTLPRRSALQVQRTVLYALFIRELKTRFGGRWLGALPVLIEPLAHLLFLTAVMGSAHAAFSPEIPYATFLVTGMLPFFIFKSMSFRLMDAVDANKGLFGYRQVKPIDTLLSRGLLEAGIYVVVYVIALATLGWFGLQWLPAKPLEMAGVLAMLSIFGASLGILFAVATNAFPQPRIVLRIASTPLYMLSGVIFSVSVIPQPYRSYLMWNPVLQLVELSRGTFFPHYRIDDGVSVGYVALWCLVTAVVALALYRVRRQRLAATS